jgi:hypothetical protein
VLGCLVDEIIFIVFILIQQHCNRYGLPVPQPQMAYGCRTLQLSINIVMTRFCDLRAAIAACHFKENKGNTAVGQWCVILLIFTICGFPHANP